MWHNIIIENKNVIADLQYVVFSKYHLTLYEIWAWGQYDLWLHNSNECVLFHDLSPLSLIYHPHRGGSLGSTHSHRRRWSVWDSFFAAGS